MASTPERTQLVGYNMFVYVYLHVTQTRLSMFDASEKKCPWAPARPQRRTRARSPLPAFCILNDQGNVEDCSPGAIPISSRNLGDGENSPRRALFQE